MQKAVIRALAAAALVLALSAPGWALDAVNLGTFSSMVAGNVCGGDAYTNWGCRAYLSYRIDDNPKGKNGAKGTCDWACNEVKNQVSNPSVWLEKCKAGCAKAYNMDN